MTARAIKRITVKKLFGSYDYDLTAPPQAVDPDRLLVLYGDNGTGKTTILKAVFHLLSPESGQGHKSALVQIPMARLEVEFTTGDRVWLQRKEGQLIGSFTIGLRMNKKKEVVCELVASEKGAIKASEESGKFLQALNDLDLAIYFLGDDRTVRFAGNERREMFFESDEPLENELVSNSNFSVQLLRRRLTQDLEQRGQQLLAQSMKRAELWIQSQVVRASSQGESSVNALYGEILSRIARVPLKSKSAVPDDVNALAQRMATLEDRSRSYALYGLLPEFHGKEILQIVRSASSTHAGLVSSVLTPYLESVERKLDAMEEVQRQINTLVVLVNSFYSRKHLSFDIHDGFEVRAEDGKPLLPQMLSSGERHLLLLFCSTIQTLGKQAIFMIDEPEISLNIKWQRRLLSALRECSGRNPIQYVFATHSFEILAQCKTNAIKLSDVAD